MIESTLQRTLRIRATHHYHRPDWDEARNRQAFGPVRDPHPHDWAITVTISGPIDAHGFLLDLPILDRLLAEEVGRLDGTDLNRAVPEMASGELQPTTEALARWVWRRVADRIPPPARLRRVRVAESDDLAAEYGE